jgi:hypothetical protein
MSALPVSSDDGFTFVEATSVLGFVAFFLVASYLALAAW